MTTKDLLIAKARAKHGEITPCRGKSFDECFTHSPKYGMAFWYNSVDGSTHAILEREKQKLPIIVEHNNGNEIDMVYIEEAVEISKEGLKILDKLIKRGKPCSKGGQ